MTQDKALQILQSGANVFLTGEPGAGKTHVIGLFVEWLNEQKIPHAITASTGIAASHLNGSTVHSWSGIGIRRGLQKQDLQRMLKNRWLLDRVRGTRVLVIDEISMLDAVTLNDVEAVMRMANGNMMPFGGAQVVLVGDFFQLPPVSRGETPRFAFEASAWEAAKLKVCYLTEQHRQSDPLFLEILGAMRTGAVSPAHKETLGQQSGAQKPDTKLFTHNADVEALNAAELAKLPGKEHIYEMDSSGPPALVEALKRNCLSPEHLALKQGAVVMMTRNNFKAGYVNGSIGKVEKMERGRPVVKLLTGITVRPEEAEWSFFERREKKAWVRQLPLRLAWAITVHKSQGMSLDSAQVDLTNAFEFGQGYVAISRVRTLQGLHLVGMNDKTFAMHPRVIDKDREFREASAALETA